MNGLCHSGGVSAGKSHAAERNLDMRAGGASGNEGADADGLRLCLRCVSSCARSGPHQRLSHPSSLIDKQIEDKG